MKKRPEGKGKRPRFGPPNVAKHPGMPEESFIMPNFIKWRDSFFKLVCAFVIITFLLEIASVVIMWHTGHVSSGALTSFAISHLVIPSGLNFLVLFLASAARRKLPKNNEEMRQNFLPIIAMIFICYIISIAHSGIAVTLGIFCLPIYMTTIFTHKGLCRLVSRICLVGAVIAALHHILLASGIKAREYAFWECLIMILILFVVTQIALTMLGMTEEQREKLFTYAQNIKEEQGRAEAASRAKSAFLANMSHEIRTPINAILGMGEMILRESKNDQITDYAENIYSASTSLLYLVNDVLDISKIESGKMEIVENNYDTASFIHDCCNMITERAAKKQLNFDVNCDDTLPSQLRGDEIHLRQVVTNLLSNAAKYTEKGGITLIVKSQKQDDRFFLVITVKDTGIGMTEDNVKHLFAQFTRFDLEKNRNIEGTGLGLAITKQLVELMQGSIQVESTYGEGSAFTVTIPQEVISETPMGNFHERYKEVSKKNKKRRQSFEAPEAHILVVDDVEVNLKVAVNLLKQTKIDVDTAKSGFMCLEKVTQNAYDLIFMDHMMPEMDGIETYTKMKEMEQSLNKDTPVIMLTANAITGVREQYLKVGFTDYLSKPILYDNLEKKLIDYLPPEKVQIRELDPQEEDQSEELSGAASNEKLGNLVRLQTFYQDYSKVDIIHGMSRCGQNADIYISVLHGLCGKIDPTLINISFDQKDLGRYEILIHDMKRYAADTGFYFLSQKAETLERAAQSADWGFIRQEHPSFAAECQTIINSIRQTLDRRKA